MGTLVFTKGFLQPCCCDPKDQAHVSKQACTLFFPSSAFSHGLVLGCAAGELWQKSDLGTIGAEDSFSWARVAVPDSHGPIVQVSAGISLHPHMRQSRADHHECVVLSGLCNRSPKAQGWSRQLLGALPGSGACARSLLCLTLVPCATISQAHVVIVILVGSDARKPAFPSSISRPQATATRWRWQQAARSGRGAPFATRAACLGSRPRSASRSCPRSCMSLPPPLSAW